MEVNKRHYIYNNIDNLKIHNKIIDFIKHTNVKYTENKNGIFLNLNTVDDDKIDHIYIIVKDMNDNLNHEINVEEFVKEEEDKELVIKEKQSLIIESINSNDIFLSEIKDKKERDIIEYSKLYF
tara:strand:- start:1244 stop:1615 length:372 start_codon:yes stop_codon:yes gene_type:complete